MEKSSSQDEPETPEFYCHLCSVSCASALNLQSHFLGVKHRKVEEAIRKHVADKVVEEVLPIDKMPNVTLQEHIDACKTSEPAVGLEYIYQYQRFGYNTYECKLCDCRAGLTHMFMHIVGAKHRITYLGKHHPSLGICGPYIMRGPKKLKKLRDVCLEVEKEFGRQKIQVMDGIDSQWTFNTDTTCATRINYIPDTEPGKVDFTSDDFFGTENKPEATEDKPEATEDKPVVTEHVVTFLELKAAYEERQKKALSGNIELSSEAEEKDTDKKEDSDEESKNDTPEKEECSKEPCKSDQGFQNGKQLFNYLEHFSIVDEGDAKFVNTVVEMLTMALLRHHKGCEEKKLSKSDATIEQDKCKEQVPAPSDQDPQSQSKTQLYPIPKASDRKKLMFTLSDKAQEFEENFAAEPESNGPTTTFNPTVNVFSKDRKREDTPVTQNQKPAAFQYNNKNPNRQPQPSSSLVSDSPVTQNQKPAAFQYNDRNPNRQPQPSSSLVSVQTPAYPAPQVNIQAPFAQTRFSPPHAPFPSRPPLFPIAQDDAVNKFFDSIKTMDVGEVASTLSRITATNPAFKGIHVPSLIRYLTETGKLKTPQMNQ
ncbi:uncharacterized protein DDB_G0284459-like isoform X2 [Hyla sarda]|uniref:uncharacterized protein DDB_G0284459-like isoform X2 n=1 Tax=Hyla sarda TaxID=327740 RepID=UPI0024C2907C|nr:uncharacterized protein DDB_G0284459-like isoform X2 [Hyla sarda]